MINSDSKNKNRCVSKLLLSEKEQDKLLNILIRDEKNLLSKLTLFGNTRANA